VLELMSASWVSQAVFVAAKLGIADLLADGPVKVTELASASGCTSSDGLYRVLRLLASHGIFSRARRPELLAHLAERAVALGHAELDARPRDLLRLGVV